MTNPIHNEIERTTAELDQAVAQLTALQEELQTSTYSATDRNRGLTVTVNSTGELAEVRFTSSAYRKMAPAELGQLLVDTTREARAKAMASVMAGLTGILPDSLPIAAMLSGDTALDELVATSLADYERRMPENLRTGGGSGV